jgi:flagellar export protein FliJ
MRRFQFRLEAVERHRKQQEQDKQLALARRMETVRATEARLMDMDMKEVQARREFSELGSPGSDRKPSDFWMLDQFIRGQKLRRVDAKQQLEIDEQAAGLAYREFLNARQQKKIMEKLREKKMGQYREEVRRHDTRLQDEQYVTRNRLRSGGETEDEE